MLNIDALTPHIDPKKRQIVLAAFQLFLSKGLSQTSMNDIVAASGLSKGGVYHHYSSKDDILMDVMLAVYQQNVVALEEMNKEQGSVTQRLLGLYDMVMVHKDMYAQIMHLIFEFYIVSIHKPAFKEKISHFYQQGVQTVADLIEEGVASGEFRQDLDTRQAAYCLLAITDGVGAAMMVYSHPTLKLDTSRYGIEVMLRGFQA